MQKQSKFFEKYQNFWELQTGNKKFKFRSLAALEWETKSLPIAKSTTLLPTQTAVPLEAPPQMREIEKGKFKTHDPSSQSNQSPEYLYMPNVMQPPK
jgi:hypothetical protein